MKKYVRKINYNHNNINLVASILDYYGTSSGYPTLSTIDEVLDDEYKNVVFIVLDGMGNKILESNSEFGILNESKVDIIDSVFPPTTVAAINSFESGLAPIEHGWLGWSMYFKEIGKTVDVFLESDSSTGEKLDFSEMNPKDKIKYESIFTKIKNGTFGEVERYQIYPEQIKRQEEDYTLIRANNASDFFDKISDVVNMNNKEKFIYAYWPDPDKTIHQYGTDSVITKRVIEDLEEKLEKCVSDCEDTVFIVTADHGLINNDGDYILNDYPVIYNMLLQRPDIEARTVNFRIKPGYQRKFVKEFNKLFGEDFILFSKEEILKEKLFGLNKPNQHINDFLGDFIAVAISNKGIQVKEAKPLPSFKAFHAGLTEDEVEVPLIVIKCPKQEY